MVQKKLSSPISKNTGVWGGVLKNDLQHVYKIRSHEYPYKWIGWKTLLTYTPKYRVLRGCFRKWFAVCLQMKLVQNIYPLTYIHKNGSLVPLFWKMFTDCLQLLSLNSQRKTKSAPHSKKHFSPIWIKTAFWIPCFENCSPNIYGYPHIIATEKWKPHPLLKKISLTYMHEKAVLGTMFQTVFTPCLQIVPHL